MWKWWPLLLDNEDPIAGLYNAGIICTAFWTLIIWSCLALFGG